MHETVYEEVSKSKVLAKMHVSYVFGFFVHCRSMREKQSSFQEFNVTAEIDGTQTQRDTSAAACRQQNYQLGLQQMVYRGIKIDFYY